MTPEEAAGLIPITDERLADLEEMWAIGDTWLAGATRRLIKTLGGLSA